MGQMRRVLQRNVGSIFAFQVGNNYAQRLTPQLGKYPGQIVLEKFTGLSKYTAFVCVLSDDMTSNPFSMQTPPPPTNAIDPGRAEIITRVTPRGFGIPTRLKVVEG